MERLCLKVSKKRTGQDQMGKIMELSDKEDKWMNYVF